MKSNHKYDENCTHCACDSPLFKKYAPEIFNSKFKKEFTEAIKGNSNLESTNPNQGSIIYYTNDDSAIYTMQDGKLNQKEAMAVYNGKIIALGTLSDVVPIAISKSREYRQIQLTNGETIIPGFVEPHVHIISSFLVDHWISMNGIVDQKLVPEYNLEYIKKKIPKDYNQPWILAREVDPALMYGSINGQTKEGNLITLNLDSLDDINNTKPLVFLSSSGHTFYANTEASRAVYHEFRTNDEFKRTFGLSGINPEKEFLDRTNGQFQEVDEMLWVYKTIPDNQKVADTDNDVNELTNYLTNFFGDASSHGFTYMNDASFSEIQLEVLSIYLRKNNIMKVSGAMSVANLKEAENLKLYSPFVNKEGSDFSNVRISAAKLVYDGSNQGLTGYQEEDYCTKAKATFEKGLYNFTNPPKPKGEENKPDYHKMANVLVKNKWPLMIHANGDKAVGNTLDVLTEVLGNNRSEINNIHRIEHCSIIPKDKEKCLTTIKEFNIQPSFLIGHVGYWGYVFKEAIFGEVKANNLDLCKSAIDKGIPISLHSDYPVTPVGALRMMEQAITRVMEADPLVKGNYNKSWNPEQLDKYRLNGGERIFPEEALAAVTYNAARQCGAEEWVGTITVDGAADFVILKENPITMNETTAFMKMRDIEILGTWVDGIKVVPKKK